MKHSIEDLKKKKNELKKLKLRFANPVFKEEKNMYCLLLLLTTAMHCCFFKNKT